MDYLLRVHEALKYIEEKLCSYFGEDFIMEIDKYFGNDIEAQIH
jgi:hypothetical protein